MGAAFIVELPLCHVDTSSAADAETRIDVAGNQRSVREHEMDLRGVTVLAIDDQADARSLLRRILEERHAHVIVAPSVDDGLRALDEHRPDVILCDIGMPAKDGYAFITALRSRGDLTPALAVTAFAQKDDRSRALRAGYQGHLTKPVEPSQLVAAIDALLKHSG
jgi:CheY-like chemotaxis protein